MKKRLLFIPLAAALMASCSNDDFNGANDTYTGETEIHYLAVNIVDNTDNGTRAGSTTPSDYENGLDAENEVKNIRFFLFDKDGNAFTPTAYVDATAEPLTTNDEPNVEKKLQAVIVFETKKTGDATPSTPAQIVAVLNPPTEITDIDKVSDLQDKLADYKSGLTESGKFVMTNSVYAYADESAAKEHVAFDIAQANIAKSKAAALANPVKIYVERVVAKARVGIDGTSLTKPSDVTVEGNIFAINGVNDDLIYGADGTQGTHKDIYVKLLGWNVTGTAATSRLVKKIQPTWGWNNNTWNDGNFAWGLNNDWNHPDYFRSFWAQNGSGFSKANLEFGGFDNSAEIKINLADACKSFDKSTPVYMQENAAWGAEGKDAEYGSKLIVAAQLVDKNGVGVDLGWYAGSYYMQEDLKQVVLSNAKIFKKTSSSGVDTYEPAKTSDIDIDFQTTTAAGDFVGDQRQNGVSEEINRYNCYAKAKSTTIPTGTYYIKQGNGQYTEITDITALNNALKGVGALKVWKSGYTYYWLDITHLAGIGKYGHVGVVRNHIYDYTLSSFKGFGIPVLDPSETIYPETPNDPEMMYIAAQINILSWRLVNHNNTELGW